MLKKHCSLGPRVGLWDRKRAGDFDLVWTDYNSEAVPGSVPEDYCNIYPHLAMMVWDHPGVIPVIQRYAAFPTLLFTLPVIVLLFDADNYPFVFLSKFLNVSFTLLGGIYAGRIFAWRTRDKDHDSKLDILQDHSKRWRWHYYKHKCQWSHACQVGD